MKLLRLVWIFQLCYCIQCSELILYRYSQKYSETKCWEGLISNFDTIVFKSEVEYHQNTSFKYLEFQVKKTHDDFFSTWIFFDMQQECTDHNLSRCKSSRDNLMMITIGELALKDFNQAILRATLNNGSVKLTSDEENFPTIAETTDTDIFFLVNEKEITNNSVRCSEERFNNDDIYVHFVCKSKVSPCVVEMKINEENVKLFYDIAHISLKGKFNSKKQVTVTARYAACRLDGMVNNISCSIFIDSILEDENNKPTHLQYVYMLTLGILLLITAILMILMIYCRRRIRTRGKRNEGNKGRDCNQIMEFEQFMRMHMRAKEQEDSKAVARATDTFLEGMTNVYNIRCTDGNGVFISIKEMKAQLLEKYQERGEVTSGEIN